MEKSPEQLYQERIDRVTDAIQLKIPDRVPVIIHANYFPARHTGIPCEAAFYDPVKWREANRKTFSDYEPDMARVQPPFPGKVLETLDYRAIKWPGCGITTDHGHQYMEGEYMASDEYDAFLGNFSDYLIRTYLPRTCGNLEVFKTLQPLGSNLFGYGGMADFISALATPEFIKTLEGMLKVKQEISRYRSEMKLLIDELTGLGFPLFATAVTSAPFDVLSDYFRGMRGSMLDMFRQPEKIIESCDRLLPMMIKRAISTSKKSGDPRIFIPLHRGADGFMSLSQFETFYWPTLKKLIQALVDHDLTPCVFFEGDYTTRLEYLLELPKGKVLCHFDAMDLFRAKEVLENHLCIRGNVPSSLLCVGTPDDVKGYCKKLIDGVGKGGGFILSPASSIDEAKPENVKAMIDSAKEFGVYH